MDPSATQGVEEVHPEGVLNKETEEGKEFHIEDEFKDVSLWKYVKSELTRGYLLEHDEEKYSEKREKVYTFLRIPRELEKFMFFGFFQCADAFLFVYTFLPIRVFLAIFRLCFYPFRVMSSGRRSGAAGRVMEPAQFIDLLKGIIMLVCCYLFNVVDVSMIYHIIRGQAVIKLYIFFNMLEVADRLLSDVGQDLLDSLFWTATEPRKSKNRPNIGVIPHLLLAILYVLMHTFLVLLQATTLNVAFNSHNKALLTIMMSNQFVELKGSVFKKFDKNDLYRMACSDVRERFHFQVLLFVVCLRNMAEFNWDLGHLKDLVPDMLAVFASEFLVDWIKHAFIIKFNGIPAESYREFSISLAYDMAKTKKKITFSDHSDLISRRMGFIPLPLGCLLYRVIVQSVKISGFMTIIILVLVYFILTTFKVAISILLLGKSCQYIRESRVAEAQKARKPPPSKGHHRRSYSGTIGRQTSRDVADVGSRGSADESFIQSEDVDEKREEYSTPYISRVDDFLFRRRPMDE